MGKVGVCSGAFHDTESCSRELTSAELARGDEGDSEGSSTEEVSRVGAGGSAERDGLPIIIGRVELEVEKAANVEYGEDDTLSLSLSSFLRPRVSCPCLAFVEKEEEGATAAFWPKGKSSLGVTFCTGGRCNRAFEVSIEMLGWEK